MRILVVHNKYQFAGGEDFVCESEIELLTSHGHEVETLIFDNASIKRKHHRLIAGLFVLYNPFSARRLKDKIQAFHPDVIHVHNFLPLASPSILFAAHQLGIPVVMTLHNYRLICPSATLFFRNKIYEQNIHQTFAFDAVRKKVYRNSFLETAAVAFTMALHNLAGTWKHKVSRFIVLTQFAKMKFESSGLRIRGEQLVVKPNFIDDCGEATDKRSDFFLFAGRLCEEKGVPMLLRAAARFHFKLTIIGDGPLKESVIQYTRDFPNINYLGFVDSVSVTRLIKRCRALIFPSQWYEGFPIVLLHALATGTPVIVSEIGGLGEIIQHRVNGLHFHPGDEIEFLQTIMRMNEDKCLRQELAYNARTTYLDKYTPEVNYRQLIGIYKAAIAEVAERVVKPRVHELEVSQHI